MDKMNEQLEKEVHDLTARIKQQNMILTQGIDKLCKALYDATDAFTRLAETAQNVNSVVNFEKEEEKMSKNV